MPPSASQLVYVSVGGSDVTGDGTIGNPYATIPHAISTITDASINKRYAVIVEPGNYANNIILEPWIWIEGTDPLLTRITAASITFDPVTWNAGPGTDNRAGFSNVTLVNAYTFDFSAVSSAAGKLYFGNCRFNAQPTFTAFNAINQVAMQNCLGFDGYTQNGINMSLDGTNFINGGTVTLNSINTGDNLPTLLAASGGGSDGPLVCNWSPNIGTNDNHIGVTLLSFPFAGGVTLNGANDPGGPQQPMLTATADSIVNPVTLSGGAPTPVLLTPASAVEYTPANPGAWPLPTPTQVKQALDDLIALNHTEILNPLRIAILRWYPINQVQTPVPLAIGPVSICFDGELLWCVGGSSLISINPETLATTTFALPAGLNLQALCYDGANLWITVEPGGGGAGSVLVYNIATATITHTLPTGNTPAGPCFDGLNVWIPNEVDNTVTVYNASTFTQVAGSPFAVPTNPNFCCFDGTNVWVTSFVNTVSVLQGTAGAGFGSVLATIVVGAVNPSGPNGLCFDSENIWCANYFDNSVTKIDVATRTVLANIPIGAGTNPGGVIFDGEYIVTPNYGTSSVTVILANTGAVIGTYPSQTGGQPAWICFDGANVWIANSGGSSIQKF